MSLFSKATKSKFGVSQDEMAGKQLDMTNALFNQSFPVMQQLAGRYNNFLAGNGLDVTSMPQYAALKDATERQYQVGRNNLLSTVQPGGALTSALSGLERDRASNLTQGAGNLADQEMSRAFALATGTTPVALNSMANAANTSAMVSNARAQQAGQAMQGIGYGIGSYLGNRNQRPGQKGGGSKPLTFTDQQNMAPEW